MHLNEREREREREGRKIRKENFNTRLPTSVQNENLSFFGVNYSKGIWSEI